MMRAVNYAAPGLIENLSVGMRQIPSLKSNECLVRVHYSAINRADTLQRKGLYPPPPNESDILGLEAVGVVVESSNLAKWKKNDRVMVNRNTFVYIFRLTITIVVEYPIFEI